MFYTPAICSCFSMKTESNPGPEGEQIRYLSFCHCSGNSLLAQNMCKISQIEAYNSLYNYDFIYIPETYLINQY